MRGFAMPLVVMLVLIASIVVAFLLDQHGVCNLAVARHAKGYESHHESSGIREVISRWATTTRGRLGDSLDTDGLAFRLQMPKSGTIEVRLVDGQGQCLTDTSSLSGRKRWIVETMNDILTEREALLVVPLSPGLTGDPWRRQAGPAQISLLAAPDPVIEALVAAVVKDPKMAERAIRTLTQREGLQADKAPLKKAVGALREGGLSQRELADIESMLTDKNSLWFITADVIDSGKHLVSRGGGLYEASELRADAFNQNAGFLTWEQLPLE